MKSIVRLCKVCRSDNISVTRGTKSSYKGGYFVSGEVDVFTCDDCGYSWSSPVQPKQKPLAGSRDRAPEKKVVKRQVKPRKPRVDQE
jgi:rubrerythrin